MRAAALVLVAAGCLSKPVPGPDDHLDDPARLAAGTKHACRIDAEKQLTCWGRNDRGQLAQPLSLTETGTPQLVSEDRDWDWVAAANDQTCGLRGGRVLCWGRGRAEPAEVSLPETPVSLWAGADTVCAVTDERHLFCWSDGEATQLEPAGIAAPWRAIAFAADHVCALLDGDHDVYCWGTNDVGQVGGSEPTVDVDHAVQRSDQDFVAVATGTGISCAITVDRSLACWGAAARTGAMTDGPELHLDTVRRWTSVAVGTQHVCSVGDGDVYCTGDRERGATGTFGSDTSMPVLPALHLVAGDSFSCAVDAAGTLSCWGSNEFGELGNHEVASQRAPVAIGLTATQLALGGSTSCAIDAVQTLSCWGDNRSGQIDPDVDDVSVVRPRSLGTYRAVAPGLAHTCAITGDGTAIDCWGDNASGRLGVADPAARRGRIDASSLAGATTFLEVSTSARASCALTDAHEVVCWGDLPGGTASSAPTTLNGTYEHVAAGATFAIATAQPSRDTAVVGTIGDCIDSTAFPSAQPIIAAESGSTSVALAAAPDASHFCVADGGRLTCGGANDAGQSAQAVTTGCRAPAVVPPPGSATWSGAVAVASTHSCAIADGRLYCWGGNAHGELAAITAGKTTPQLVDTATWSAIATGTYHSCGTASDGAVSCWGENRFGELGDGASYHALPIVVTP